MLGFQYQREPSLFVHLKSSAECVWEIRDSQFSFPFETHTAFFCLAYNRIEVTDSTELYLGACMLCFDPFTI